MSTGDLIHTLAFYFLGVVAVAAALAAVASQRILRSALGLAATLVCGAGFYILLSYDFIAAIQILVYVGGIVILIVFAIMLTSSLESLESQPSPLRWGLALVASLSFFVVAMLALTQTNFAVDTISAPPGDIALSLGRILLSVGAGGYVLPFEIISLLLLAAVIGAIVIARSHRTALTRTE
jgi:NADH-quinone oxidoreductase subunit J